LSEKEEKKKTYKEVSRPPPNPLTRRGTDLWSLDILIIGINGFNGCFFK